MTTKISTPIRKWARNRRRKPGLRQPELAGDGCDETVAERGLPIEAALTPEPEITLTSAAEARAVAPELPLALEPRLMRFRSARTSAALWQRRSESFSKDFSTTSLNANGSVGFNSVGGGGVFS